MSRRARRERPATAAEQRQVERFAALAETAISGPPEQRAAAVRRMTRVADRLRDPDDLTGLPARDLLDAIAERFPNRGTPSRSLTDKNGAYGAPENGRNGQNSGPVRAGETVPSTTEGAT